MPVQSSDTSGSNDDNACHAGEIALFVIHETDYVCALANTALILILYMYSCKLVSASERSHTAFPITRYCNCKVQVSGCWFGPATARLYEALSHPGVSLFCQSAHRSIHPASNNYRYLSVQCTPDPLHTSTCVNSVVIPMIHSSWGGGNLDSQIHS